MIFTLLKELAVVTQCEIQCLTLQCFSASRYETKKYKSAFSNVLVHDDEKKNFSNGDFILHLKVELRRAQEQEIKFSFKSN